MAVAITTPEDPVNPAYDDVIRMIDSGGKSLTLVVVGKPAVDVAVNQHSLEISLAQV